jgi:hypothetical protein
MAVYRFEAKIIGRSSGRSATGAAAYRAAERILDERTGIIRDYTRKQGGLHKEIMTPGNPGHKAGWPQNRAKLWNAVEKSEKRKDAQLAREILVNLPHELTLQQQIRLLQKFVRDEFVRRGMVADIAIHAPHRKGDHRNTHAHVMLSMRELTADGFGAKVRDWNSPERLEQWREKWADYQNEALKEAGLTVRVDHRSLEARGIEREPEPKQGPVATDMERNGRPSKAGDDRRAAKARNAQLDGMEAEKNVVDLQIARIQRQEQRDEKRRGQPVSPASPETRAAEQARFEEWANVRRAGLQNDRHEAEGEQGRTHEREKLALRNEQAVRNGSIKREHAASLAMIAKRQQERSERKGLGGILARMSGAARRDSDRAGRFRSTLADIASREAEQNGALTARQQAETASLSADHARQEARLEQRIENARDRREREGWQPHRETRREATTGQEIEPSADIDREAENLPVEGREAGRGETTPQEPEATHAQPEAAQEGDTRTPEEREAAIQDRLDKWQEQREGVSRPRTGWESDEERQAAIDAARERREANERDSGHDHDDPGRTRTR